MITIKNLSSNKHMIAYSIAMGFLYGATLYSASNSCFNDGHKKGFEDGRKKGFEDGRKKGLEEVHESIVSAYNDLEKKQS